MVSMEAINVLFTEYTPGKRHKVQIPCWLDGLEDSFALKKGALLQKMVDYIPMYWRGGEHIPQGITADLLHAKPPTSFRLDRTTIPEGLTLVKPHHDYVFAKILGSRKYTNADDEE
jgi:hypothetical protein